MTFWEKRLRSLVGKAIHHYDLIQDGDRILVGVSGGKDSLSLLQLLFERRDRVPINYELIASHIDLGFGSKQANVLKDHFENMGIQYHIEITDIGLRANSSENRENPCFLCSWERRKRLFKIAQEMKCNKIALGHHKDDIIETFLLNIFYSSEISTMLPIQTLFKGKITIIRPLVFIEEKMLHRYAIEKGLPFGSSGCPVSGKTKRAEIKRLIETLEEKNKKVKGNIFRALSNIKPDYMFYSLKKVK